MIKIRVCLLRNVAQVLSVCVFVATAWCMTALAAETPAGEQVYQDHCAKCHDNKASGAPSRSIFSETTVASIYHAVTTGPMRAQAQGLSESERRQVAEFLSGEPLADSPRHPLNMCGADTRWFDARKKPVGMGWGIDPENTRLISSAQAGLTARDLGHLQLRWTFAFPEVSRAVAQPLVMGGGLFVGSQDGTIYALDAKNGCVYWTFKAGAEVVGAIVPFLNGETSTLIFGDRFAIVYALNARTGALRWRAKVDDHPSAMVVGTPALMDERIFVPVSSEEESEASPKDRCCTFRGSVVALSAVTGEQIWKSYTIPEPPKETSKNSRGIPQFGPSGAGIWVTPAIDRSRDLLYVATGNNYSDPGDQNSDAIFAMEMSTGKIRWRTQTLPDVYNNWDWGCEIDESIRADPDCPSLKKRGPDIDINGSPVLVRGAHKDILVVGRKDGRIFGVDPDSGSIRWSVRNSTSNDPYAGALWYGVMVDGRTVIIPSIGTKWPHVVNFVPDPDDGLYALDASSGSLLWTAKSALDCPEKPQCFGIPSTPIGFPGVVFAGAADGYVRAYDSHSGNVLWRFDTARNFTTTSGETAKGGGVARNGIMLARGMLYVSSGFYQRPGNVLLAFSVQ